MEERGFTLEQLMAQASARHILVDTEEKCLALKTEIEGGADFAAVAKANSSCPSGAQGGGLGFFGPGRIEARSGVSHCFLR